MKSILEGQLCTVGSIYAPNQSQLEFLDEALLKLGSFREGHLILGGDLNYVVDLYKDKQTDRSLRRGRGGGRQAKTPHRKVRGTTGLNDLFGKFQLLDVWRLCNPSGRDFTFFSNRFNSFSRIDYLLVSSSSMHSLISCDIGLRRWSDHAPVIGDFFLPHRGPKDETLGIQ